MVLGIFCRLSHFN